MRRDQPGQTGVMYHVDDLLRIFISGWRFFGEQTFAVNAHGDAARVKLIEQFARAHGFFRRCSTLPAPGSVTAGTEALLHRSGSTDEHK